MEWQLLNRYRGPNAESYESQRAREPKWTAEEVAVSVYLTITDPKSVLDIPVGTGRFLPLYSNRNIRALGMDQSPDMLKQAGLKGTDAILSEGNVLHIPMADGAVDVAICVRLLNWLSPDDLLAAIKELRRVSEVAVIVSIRLSDVTRDIGEGYFLHRRRDFYRCLSQAKLLLPLDLILLDQDCSLGEYSMHLLKPL